jgi:hypothetical protein
MFMRIVSCLLLLSLLSSCWKWKLNIPDPITGGPGGGGFYNKVWGSKPIYSRDSTAKLIYYTGTPQPVVSAGNIYVKDNFIFQVEVGKGIHVIDNSTPANAHRIGFITINGCSQISIKGSSLYSNSYDDLVVVDVSDASNIKESSRIKGALPEGRYMYPYAQPLESGYYECPRYDSLVTGWKKDSVMAGCYKK